MKKSIKKIIALLIASVLCFAVTACSPKEIDDVDDVKIVKTLYNKNEIEEVSDTDIIFISNGVSDYQIVLPAGALKNTTEYASASELQYFVKDVTGVTLPIVYDNGLTFDESNKYISIGNTTIFRDTSMYTEIYGDNPTMKYEDFGNDGIRIITYGKTVVMNALGGNGMVYCAYGFLERVLDWTYYAEDCWKATEDTTIYLKQMNVADIPTFRQRQLNTGASNDAQYAIRLRQHGSQGQSLGGNMEGSGWCLGDQSIAQEIILPQQYIGNHPSWYYLSAVPPNGQPCISALLQNFKGDEDKTVCYDNDYVGGEYDLTNDDYAFNAFMKNLIVKIQNNPLARVFMLGQNDNGTPCQCATCKQYYKEIKASGQYCLLANKTINAIREWQASLPDGDRNKTREINVAFFAYYFTIEPPVKTVKEGEYVPIRDDVVLDKNVIVRIAPINASYAYELIDFQKNPESAFAFSSWSVVAKTLAVWDYSCNFCDALPYFADDFGTLEANYLMYREAGVKEVFTQFPSRTSGFGFRPYKMWLRSQLEWDIDQDTYDLTQEFFINYYGEDAGKVLLRYYEYMQSVYITMALEGKYDGSIYVRNITGLMGYNVLANMGQYFNEALASIEHLRNEDAELFATYDKRVHCEMLVYWYGMLSNYNDYLTAEQINEFCDNFEYWRKIAGLKLREIYGGGADVYFDGFADSYRVNI